MAEEVEQPIVQPLPEEARCVQCGYSLHALLTDRCPECGQVFDRTAVLALLKGQHAKLPFDATAAKWLSAPPWWGTVVALVAVVMNFSSEAILPVEAREPSAQTFPLFGIAVGIFLLKIIDRSKVSARYDLSNAPARRFGFNWILLPLACLLYFPSFGNDVVMRIAFAASEPRLNVLAKQVIASQSSPPDQRVGFYDAVYICPTSDGMNLRLAGYLEYGFAYTTTGSAPRSRPNAEPMGGGWYAF
jgi:hypothetical protein